MDYKFNSSMVLLGSLKEYILSYTHLYLFFFLKIILIGGWLIYNIVVVFHTFTWISHGCTCVPHPDTPSHLSPFPIPQGHPSAPALSTLSHASNLDWQSISRMIIYLFQCYSLKSSYPRLLPQSPKVCSLYLCLFCCLAYRIIVTIFLNAICMHSDPIRWHQSLSRVQHFASPWMA